MTTEILQDAVEVPVMVAPPDEDLTLQEKVDRLRSYLQQHPGTRLMDLEQHRDAVRGPLYILAKRLVKDGKLFEHPQTKALEFPGGAAPAKAEPEVPPAETIMIKALQDLPAIAEATTSPVKKGELAHLPAVYANALIKKGAAIKVEDARSEAPMALAMVVEEVKVPCSPPSPAPPMPPKVQGEINPKAAPAVAAPPVKEKDIAIPGRLCNQEFRFVKVLAKEKRAFEKDWPNTANYRFDDPKLLDHLARGGNYGVMGRCGGLVLIDADEPEIKEAVERSLPRTFSVKSGRSGEGGYHFYYYCNEAVDTAPLNRQDGARRNVGHIKAKGGYVVGPGSIHPDTGKAYAVIDDCEIATVEAWQLRAAFSDFLPRPRLDTRESNKGGVQDGYRDTELEALKVTDFIQVAGFRLHGDWLRGPNPWHGSTTGGNFDVNVAENYWHCFRCESTGDALDAFAIDEGLAKCEDFCKGGPRLRGENFKHVLEVARDKGVLKAAPERKARRKSGTVASSGEEMGGRKKKAVLPPGELWDEEGILGYSMVQNGEIITRTLDEWWETEPDLARLIENEHENCDEVYYLPGRPDTEHEDLTFLDDFIRILDRFCDLPPRVSKTTGEDSPYRVRVATHVTCSAFYDMVSVRPGLLSVGETTSGKTRLMTIIARSSLRGFAIGVPTEAVMMRNIGIHHVTLSVDETKDLGPELLPLVLTIFKLSYDGQNMGRADQNNQRRTIVYPCKSFVALSMKSLDNVPDDTINRGTVIHMGHKTRGLEDKEPNHPMFASEFKILRTRVVAMRLRALAGKINVRAAEERAEELAKAEYEFKGKKCRLESRHLSKAAVLLIPIVLMGEDPQKVQDLMEVMLCSKLEAERAQGQTRAAKVWFTVYDLAIENGLRLTDEGTPVSFSGADITTRQIAAVVNQRLRDDGELPDDKKLPTRTVTSILDSLKFEYRMEERLQRQSVLLTDDASFQIAWKNCVEKYGLPSKLPRKSEQGGKK